jgi:hypothetical protein
MPHSVALSVPLLVMPPANLPTCCIRMPLPCAEIVSLLVMPPPTLWAPNEPTLLRRIPLFRTEIVPLLLMPPAKVETSEIFSAVPLPP